MQTTLSILALISVVAAQIAIDSSGLSPCVQNCLKIAVDATGCGNDLTCICTTGAEKFEAAYLACLSPPATTACTAAEGQEAEDFARKACPNAGSGTASAEPSSADTSAAGTAEEQPTSAAEEPTAPAGSEVPSATTPASSAAGSGSSKTSAAATSASNKATSATSKVSSATAKAFAAPTLAAMDAVKVLGVVVAGAAAAL